MHLMLLMNGYDLASSTKMEVEMTEKVASGKMKETEIAIWLEKNFKKKKQD